jgi:hypothetical protein
MTWQFRDLRGIVLAVRVAELPELTTLDLESLSCACRARRRVVERYVGGV